MFVAASSPSLPAPNLSSPLVVLGALVSLAFVLPTIGKSSAFYVNLKQITLNKKYQKKRWGSHYKFGTNYVNIQDHLEIILNFEFKNL